ncbi:MAG: hypothetical protein ACRDCE_02255 [Cetobacterium sp.]|uniref:hypothetical protein n=1 Tax=Cetobacterium sp. TaxID=2071632 RepID=UPI003EE6CD9D
MRVNTYPLPYNHRDMVHRVIRRGDYVMWSNGKYGQRMRLCEVMNATEEKINILPVGAQRVTIAYPSNLMVVTAQIEKNVEGNVGANLDLEATR